MELKYHQNIVLQDSFRDALYQLKSQFPTFNIVDSPEEEQGEGEEKENE